MILMSLEMPYSPTVKGYVKRIQDEVPVNDLYNELAEEASELSQAALKMVRVGNPTNPTPTSLNEAYVKLIEEFTDVLNVGARVLGLEPDWLVGDYKLYRWTKRLDEAQGKQAKDYCEITDPDCEG